MFFFRESNLLRIQDQKSNYLQYLSNSRKLEWLFSGPKLPESIVRKVKDFTAWYTHFSNP